MLWIYGLNVMLLEQGRGKWRFCLKLLQYCYIRVQCIYELKVMLVQGRGEMAVLPEDTVIQLHHCAMYIWTDFNVVNTE